MNLKDVIKYIKENTLKTKEKIKENFNDKLDENNRIVQREYSVKYKYDIEDKFIIDMDEESVYLTHIYINPNQDIELEDDGD